MPPSVLRLRYGLEQLGIPNSDAPKRYASESARQTQKEQCFATSMTVTAMADPQAFGPTARGLHGRLSVHHSEFPWQLRAGGHCGQAWQHAARGAS